MARITYQLLVLLASLLTAFSCPSAQYCSCSTDGTSSTKIFCDLGFFTGSLGELLEHDLDNAPTTPFLEIRFTNINLNLSDTDIFFLYKFVEATQYSSFFWIGESLELPPFQYYAHPALVLYFDVNELRFASAGFMYIHKLYYINIQICSSSGTFLNLHRVSYLYVENMSETCILALLSGRHHVYNTHIHNSVFSSTVLPPYFRGSVLDLSHNDIQDYQTSYIISETILVNNSINIFNPNICEQITNTWIRTSSLFYDLRCNLISSLDDFYNNIVNCFPSRKVTIVVNASYNCYCQPRNFSNKGGITVDIIVDTEHCLPCPPSKSDPCEIVIAPSFTQQPAPRTRVPLTDRPTLTLTRQSSLAVKAGSTLPPTAGPTLSPTAGPTLLPTAGPTLSPTAGPTLSPTAGPTLSPTAGLTLLPTTRPTLPPTAGPTLSPTAGPTLPPTAGPTLPPTAGPILPQADTPVTNQWLLIGLSCGLGAALSAIISLAVCLYKKRGAQRRNREREEESSRQATNKSEKSSRRYLRPPSPNQGAEQSDETYAIPDPNPSHDYEQLHAPNDRRGASKATYDYMNQSQMSGRPPIAPDRGYL